MPDLAQFFHIWGAMISTLALIATLITIIVYTSETRKLRKATVEHNELQLRPCITVYSHSLVRESQHPYFKNIGKSTALNIRVDRIAFEGVKYYDKNGAWFTSGKFNFGFNKINFLEVGGEENLKPSYDSRDDKTLKWLQDIGMTGFPFITFKEEYSMTVHYENIENQPYYSKILIDCKQKEIKLSKTGKVNS